MIQKLEIAGVHMDVSDDLKKYVLKKIGKLDNYMPKRARNSAHAEVKLMEEKIKVKKQYTCEVILYLPHGTITTKETTVNVFAAVDIVEAKLKNQIKKYKDLHSSLGLRKRILARIKRRGV